MALCFGLSAWAQGVPGVGSFEPTVGGGGGTAITLVAHTAAGSANQNNVTTPAINTTGANAIVLGVALYNSSASVTDSLSNTWLPINSYTAFSNQPFIQMFQCQQPCTVGTGHTFTESNSGSPLLFAAAFSNIAASPVDQQNGGNSGTPATTVQPGSITPNQNNEVVVTLLGAAAYTGTTVNSISSGFTVTDYISYDNVGYTHIGGAFAYSIQTTASAVNPTWTVASGAQMYMVSSIASLK